MVDYSDCSGYYSVCHPSVDLDLMNDHWSNSRFGVVAALVVVYFVLVGHFPFAVAFADFVRLLWLDDTFRSAYDVFELVSFF